MQPLAINAQHAVAIHDTLVDFKNILEAAPCEGFEELVGEITTTLGFDIQEMQQDVLDRVVKATGEPVVTGGQSLVVSKAEHDRVLEQLKRYSGE